MLILALDASTPVTTVALAREKGREVLAEISVTARGASETLLPAIHAALDIIENPSVVHIYHETPTTRRIILRGPAAERLTRC